MHCEYRIIGKNGRVIWIHEEAEALADDGGRPLYLQGVMYDVTEQKNAEAQLVKALDRGEGGRPPGCGRCTRCRTPSSRPSRTTSGRRSPASSAAR